MKIFKLKYLALTLVATTLVSCVKDDVIKEADKAAITSSNSFTFDEAYKTYIINGNISFNREEIASAAKDAWNVHYDGSKGRVVISTTPAEFEKYKNSNIEFKKQLAESDKEAMIQNRPAPLVTKAIPAGGPASVLAIFENKVVLAYTYENSTNNYFVQFVPTSDADLNATDVYRKIWNSNGSTVTSDFAQGLNHDFDAVFANYYGFTNVDGAINNVKTASTHTETFYKNDNYLGTSKSYTAPKKGWVKLTDLVFLEPSSYK